MPVSSLPALPAVIVGSVTLVAWAVSGVLALLSVPIAAIPGFRPADANRDALVHLHDGLDVRVDGV